MGNDSFDIRLGLMEKADLPVREDVTPLSTGGQPLRRSGKLESPQEWASTEAIVEKAVDRATSVHIHFHAPGENTVGDSFNIGDVSGSAVGRGAKLDARDIAVYHSNVDSSANLDCSTKVVLKEARAMVDKLDLAQDERADVIDDLGRLTGELSKPEPNKGRIGRLWNSIKEIAPTVGAILEGAGAIAKLLSNS